MLYAVIKILHGIKILRAKNSTSDMPRTWSLHNFKEVRLCLMCLFVSIAHKFIFIYHSRTICIFMKQSIKTLRLQW